MNEATRRILTLCAIRIDGKSLDWSLIARAARDGHLDELWDGHVPARETTQARAAATALLHAGLRSLDEPRARVNVELDAGHRAGARLITVLDEDYPSNLRQVPDLPPFLFVLGQHHATDERAVAVVGTRQATTTGLRRASRLATELTRQGVTIASGLARGVDTVAHTAALDAGGRTLAVIGTGITRCYPAENKTLAEQITRHGAVISQFWPTRPPGRDTFPRRNRVTSGISLGTAVIEASSTSGAKMQARLASEHGKHVWLMASLVAAQPWAQKMISQGRARTVSTTADILEDLSVPATTAPAAVQSTLDLS